MEVGAFLLPGVIRRVTSMAGFSLVAAVKTASEALRLGSFVPCAQSNFARTHRFGCEARRALGRLPQRLDTKRRGSPAVRDRRGVQSRRSGLFLAGGDATARATCTNPGR